MDEVIIYRDKIPKNISTKIKKYKSIGDLYYARVKNPPFYNKIYVFRDDLTEEKLKKIYNMCLENGTIYFLPKYKKFFGTKTNYLKKKNNLIYTITSERTVDFIIMGVQRGGTTSLSYNLSKHPEIYINSNKNPEISEVHYFDIKLHKGLGWYKKQFNYKFKCVGEKTPDLINIPYTFPIIQSVNPYVKLIILLRDPIARAYSAWKLEISRDRESRSFEDAIQDELKEPLITNHTFYTIEKKYLQRGLYSKYIKELINWFPIQNLFFILFDDIRDNPKPVYKEIYKFLNLKNVDLNITKEHVSIDKTQLDDKFKDKIKNYFEDDVKQLEKIINRKIHWFDKKQTFIKNNANKNNKNIKKR